MIASGSNRVIRGGSWNNNAQNARSANRNNNDPSNRNDNVGFRLASTGNLPDRCRSRMTPPCIRLCPDHDPVLRHPPWTNSKRVTTSGSGASALSNAVVTRFPYKGFSESPYAHLL